jgi:hypothetical protein
MPCNCYSNKLETRRERCPCTIGSNGVLGVLGQDVAVFEFGSLVTGDILISKMAN